jgi:diaminopimelate epimerase
MKFTKMHGCGNDYIYIDCTKIDLENKEEFAKKYSDRHKGIGSDGFICICNSNVADFKMKMYNSDGSEGDMCGNGIRCVTKYVRDHNLTDKKELKIETNSGIKNVKIMEEKDKISIVEVDMGEYSTNAYDIPVIHLGDSVIEKQIDFLNKKINITCISMGNPHTIIFVDDIISFPLETFGPLLETYSIFPNKSNIEIVHIINDEEIEMRVWERGSGETMACGTGACACVVASYLTNKTKNKVMVHLLGGDLKIEIKPNKKVYMVGEAETIYEGEI